jgi:hypothetical protein
MNTRATSRAEHGAVLVIAMLFLLVVTIISVVAARNSTLSTKMSSNIQDTYSSFQSAEAGMLATMLLTKTASDPFMRQDVSDPFKNFTPANHPLRDLNGGGAANMTVKTYYDEDTVVCPRMAGNRATSVDTFDCEYYRIESKHEEKQRARTLVDQGVVKTVMKIMGG